MHWNLTPETSPHLLLTPMRKVNRDIRACNIKSHLQVGEAPMLNEQKYRVNSKCSRLEYIHQWNTQVKAVGDKANCEL